MGRSRVATVLAATVALACCGFAAHAGYRAIDVSKNLARLDEPTAFPRMAQPYAQPPYFAASTVGAPEAATAPAPAGKPSAPSVPRMALSKRVETSVIPLPRPTETALGAAIVTTDDPYPAPSGEVDEAEKDGASAAAVTGSAATSPVAKKNAPHSTRTLSSGGLGLFEDRN